MKKVFLLFVALCLLLLGVSALAEESVALPEPGVTIAKNTDFPYSDAAYQVTFTYQASSTEVESVSLVGN